MSDSSAFRQQMLLFHQRSGREFPWRATSDPYAVLIGEVLLQRTKGGSLVVEVYRDFLRRWPTPEKLARARVRTIEHVIRPLGLVKRAPILKELGREIVEFGETPTTPDRLRELPGVGPYGAHAVAVFGLGRDLPLVDWVIARLLRRYFGLPMDRRPNADSALWEVAARLAEEGEARELWLGVLDFAAALCRPRPRCDECPLASSCSWASSRGTPSADHPM